jgi:type I restriction enzyme S subunit
MRKDGREIPAGWTVGTLGEVAVFSTGKLNSNASVQNGKYPFFTCSPETLRINDYAFEQEALLLAGNNANAIYSLKYYKGKFNAYQRTYIIGLKNPVQSDYKYLFYALNLKLNYLKDISHGSATQFLTVKILDELDILLPPLPEQRAIAAVLSSLDDKIELLRDQNKTLEAIAQTLFKRWFVEFEFPDEFGKPYKSSGGEMVDSELGEIPSGWRVGKIYELLEVDYGYPFKSELFNTNKDGLPLIRIRDLKDGDPSIFTNEICPQNYVVFPGDIIAGMDAEFRLYVWKGEKGLLNQRVCRFRPKEFASHIFVLETMRPFLAFYERTKTGTTVSHLGKSDLDFIEAIIPEKSLIELFSNSSEAIFRKIIANNSQIQTHVAIRDVLIPKLISGKIRLPETEKFIRDAGA